MLKLKLQYFGHLMHKANSLEKFPWCSEILRAGGERGNRGWDGWMASLTPWTWVWENSGKWWRTGKAGVLQSMESQRAEYDLEIEQQKQFVYHTFFFFLSLSLSHTHTLAHTPLLDSPIHYSCQVMSIPCLDNCNARHLCIFKAAHPIHVKFWPMKIIPNIQIKLLLLSKLLPPLCLCPDSLIPREQVRTEYVTIHQIFVDSNHSPMDLLFLVGFFLFVTVNWHPHMQDTHSSLKQMRRSGCFWTVLNSLFFTSMADQPLSSAYSTICKTLM